MIYEKMGHGIYEPNGFDGEGKYSLVMDTLELIIDYNANSLQSVYGYFPLVKAKRNEINIPKCEQGEYILPNSAKEGVRPTLSMAFDYFYRFPNAKEIFTLENKEYDEPNGTIKYGRDSKEYKHIKINKNIVVAIDDKNELVCLYIMPDEFV